MKKFFIFIIIVTLLLAVVVFLFPTKVSKQKKPLPIPTTAPISYPSPGVPLKQGAGSEPEEYQKAEEEFVKSHPILQRLPPDSPYFDIEYISEKHLVVYPRVSNKNEAYEAARVWFLQNKIDLSKVKIEYR